MDRTRYEDEGPPNPRQAEVDRLRDAATKHAAPRRSSSGGDAAPSLGSADVGSAEVEPGSEQR